MLEVLKKETKDLMDKSIQGLKGQFSKMRTGKASASMLEGIKVNYYGSPAPMSQVGRISTPEARILQIQPFDKTLIGEIEKAIFAANLGVTPANDGNMIRLIFPSLTEEKRKDLVKNVKKVAEDGKVAIRNIRRDQNEKIKKLEKDKEISEDESKKFQQQIQETTDQYIKDIDKLLLEKEKELMTV